MPNTLALPAPFEDKAFRRRRTQNWVVLGLLYSLFYMSRYNYTAVNSFLAQDLGWKNTELGVFETMMPLVYGLSVVINGPLADKIGGKKAFLFGAAGATVMNLLFGCAFLAIGTPAQWTGKELVAPATLNWGLSGSLLLTLMAVAWGINGYFQSFGALSIVKVNAQWFHRLERGTFSGIFGVLIRFGLILAFSFTPMIAASLGWQWAFWLPGILVGVVGLLNWKLMEKAPQDAGWEVKDTGDATEHDDEKPVSVGYVLKKVFASRTTWTIAVASMMIGLVRRSTVDSWFPRYFTSYYDLPRQALATNLPYQCSTWGIALLGILGGFAFGITSDRVFSGRRAPVITFGFVGMAVMLTLFWLSDIFAIGQWGAVVCIACLSFFVNGAHGMIGGAASMDFGGRKAAASAAGLFDGMQYLAAAPVGIGMGIIIDNPNLGWMTWHWAPIPFAIIGALVIATLWNVAPGRKGH